MTPERLLETVAGAGFEVPEGLVRRTLARLGADLEHRRSVRRTVVRRVSLVGVLSLPFVAFVSVAEVVLLHSTLDHYLPSAAASFLTSAFAISLLLAIALAYGSLPLLASWGCRLREGTP
ncbi:MAG TPA: hypothetical protein VEK15_20550 [Vicinamibacteria bacterium]|nr:hypothetical protein [Vicinamibacteria bacterium]